MTTRNIEEERDGNAEKRTVLKLLSWNVRSFEPRVSVDDALFALKGIDPLFVCETKQKR